MGEDAATRSWWEKRIGSRADGTMMACRSEISVCQPSCLLMNLCPPTTRARGPFARQTALRCKLHFLDVLDQTGSALPEKFTPDR